jgi:CDP-glucose 4,6-dehydratase
MNYKDAYKNRKVLITGHTGFKGSWMVRLLYGLGADVYGYSLDAPTDPSLFKLIGLDKKMGERSRIADIRDLKSLSAFISDIKPEIVIHMAAQPIVRTSYQDPVGTYETNVMGTVNILEAVRQCPSVKSVVNVTTDKVYLNRERDEGYREDEELKGYDPYSNSKSCSELVTHSYQRSFLSAGRIAVSTARAGNVIGGGDFAADRIIPDCVRACLAGTDIVVRNPGSVRPYQHVFEPLAAYLLIAMEAALDKKKEGWYNVGPDREDCVTTGVLTDLFIEASGGTLRRLSPPAAEGPHEAGLLMLDNAKIRRELGWEPHWHIRDAVQAAAAWTKAYAGGGAEAANAELLRQLEEYLAL